jgi:hypothetical protein
MWLQKSSRHQTGYHICSHPRPRVAQEYAFDKSQSRCKALSPPSPPNFPFVFDEEAELPWQDLISHESCVVVCLTPMIHKRVPEEAHGSHTAAFS